MTTQYREQYYVFTGPDGWAWVEMFFDSTHVTCPSPCQSVDEEVALLKDMHPNALVDSFDDDEQITDAMRYTNAYPFN